MRSCGRKPEADVDVYRSFPISGRAAQEWSWGAGRKFRVPGLPGRAPLSLVYQGFASDGTR
jgi:hypothetical protein